MPLEPMEVTRTFGHEITNIVIGGTALVKESETILRDASRSVDLALYTVMAQITASKKWVPWLLANLSATDGSAIPCGILCADGGIAAAALAAGDVTAPILIGTCVELDAAQLVFDKGSTGAATACTLDTTTSVLGTALRGETLLAWSGIFVRTLWTPGF